MTKYAVILIAIVAGSALADYTDLRPGASGAWIGTHLVDPPREWTRLEWTASPWAPLPADTVRSLPAVPFVDLVQVGQDVWAAGLAAGEYQYAGDRVPAKPAAVWLARQAQVGMPAGAAGRWTFDNPANPGADSSGNGRNLSLVGTAAWTASGLQGGAISFPDATARLDMTAWAHGGNYTLVAWVRDFVPTVASRTLFSGGTSRRHLYLTNATGTNANLAMFDTSARTSLYRLNPADWPTWTMVGVTATGGVSTFWVDGRVAGTVNFAVTTNLSTIGNFTTGNERFASFIDEAVVYGRALTVAEMGQLYEAFAWRHYQQVIAPEGTPGQLDPETWGWDGATLHVRLHDDADPDAQIGQTVQSGPATLGETVETPPVGIWHFEEAAAPFADLVADIPLAATGTVETREPGIWDYAVRLSPGAALAADRTATMDVADLTIHAWLYADVDWMDIAQDAVVVGRAAPVAPWRVVARPNDGDPILQFAMLRDGQYEYGPSIRVQALRLGGWSQVAWTFEAATGYAAAYSCGRMVDYVEMSAGALPGGAGGLIVGAPASLGLTELAILPWAISADDAWRLWLRGTTGVRAQVSVDGGLTWTDESGIQGGHLYAPADLRLPTATGDFQYRFQLWSYEYAATPEAGDIQSTYIADIPRGAAVAPAEPLALGTGSPIGLSHEVDTAGGEVRYRLSPYGDPTWYHWSGGQWNEVVDLLYSPATTNSPAELAAGLLAWHDAFPDEPDIYWIAYLDSVDTYRVTLDAVSMTYVGGFVAVDSPTAGQLAEYGKPLSIAWSSSGTVSGRWNLDYSVDGLAWLPIAANVAGSSYVWTPPAAAESTIARVRVRDAADSAIQAASDPFWIAPPPIRFTAPAAGADIMAGAVTAIAWSVRNGVTPSADCVLEYSTDNGQAWTTIAVLDGAAGAPPTPWVAPVLTAPLTIRLRDPHVAANTAQVACSLRIGYVLALPERLYAGAVCPVEWTASVGSWPVADLHYSLDSGRTWTAIDRVASVPGQTSQYAWRTPRGPAASALLRIRSIADHAQAHQATTTLAMLRIDAPTAGQATVDGQPLAIRWTSAGAGATVAIQYATSDSLGAEPTVWQTLAAAAPNTGLYYWTVDAWPTSRARVRVRSTTDIHLQSISPEFAVEVAP
jgi:hypothetical protein